MMASDTPNDKSAPHSDIDLKTLENLVRDTAVGDTMYEKKWVIENILEVGRHFQNTLYSVDGKIVELDPKIEELMCTLWDISVEKDVSLFYVENGVLDILVEFFSNPNVRVKEISVGVMANIVSHLEVFEKIIDDQRYLNKCLCLLEEKDSPTLSIALKCLHCYGFNLFTLLTEKSTDAESDKERLKQTTSTWLIYLGSEMLVRNLGIIIASCTNKEVLNNGSRLLSVIASLWEFSEEKRKVSQFFAENNFLLCVLEGTQESICEDKTVKHFLVFLHTVYEISTDKDLVVELSQKVVDLVAVILNDHVLEYSKIEDTDIEFIFNIVSLLESSLASGGYDRIGSGFSENLSDLRHMLEDADLTDTENRLAILQLLKNCQNIITAFNEVQINGDKYSSEETSESPRH